MSERAAGPSRARVFFLAGVSGILLAAAVLKGYQLVYRESAAIAQFSSVGFYVALVIGEFVLGIWLITGLYWKLTRVVGMLVFFGFMQAGLWLALTGHKTCACLGPLNVSPWFAVALDLAILAGLAVLRSDVPVRTIHTHPFTFGGFLLATLALGVPGFMTMAAFRSEGSKDYSYDLRHDRLLHQTKVSIDLRQPTVEDLVALTARQLGVSLSVDDAVRDHFDSCQLDWKLVNHQTQRGWAVLEAVTKRMPVSSRWVKTAEGYRLIADDPVQRSMHYWLAGLGFGAVGFCCLAFRACCAVPAGESVSKY